MSSKHLSSGSTCSGSTAISTPDLAPKGQDEHGVRLISAKKGEPEWLLERRLAAFRHFL